MCANAETKAIIEEYLKGSKKTVSFLAVNSGVGRSTIDRILRQELKKEPSPDPLSLKEFLMTR